MPTSNEYLLWKTIYRCLSSITAAIKKYKLEPLEIEVRKAEKSGIISATNNGGGLIR